eukprot:GEMP01017841.1.p1 GENE.GEMP01017841.1~~GEMP01017841.1.p1  ORF type:complete len:522 (+),score=118.30 GEMP01017841.1:183-1748(+)
MFPFQIGVPVGVPMFRHQKSQLTATCPPNFTAQQYSPAFAAQQYPPAFAQQWQPTSTDALTISSPLNQPNKHHSAFAAPVGARGVSQMPTWPVNLSSSMSTIPSMKNHTQYRQTHAGHLGQDNSSFRRVSLGQMSTGHETPTPEPMSRVSSVENFETRSVASAGSWDVEREANPQILRQKTAAVKAERLETSALIGPLAKVVQEKKRVTEVLTKELAEKKEREKKILARIEALRVQKRKNLEDIAMSDAMERANTTNRHRARELDNLEALKEQRKISLQEEYNAKRDKYKEVTQMVDAIRKQSGPDGSYEKIIDQYAKELAELVALADEQKQTEARVLPEYNETLEELERVKEQWTSLESEDVILMDTEAGSELADIRAKFKREQQKISKVEASLKFEEDLNKDVLRQVEVQMATNEETVEKIQKLKSADRNHQEKVEDQPIGADLSRPIREAKAEVNKLEKKLDAAIRVRPVPPHIRKQQIKDSARAKACTSNFRLQMESKLLTLIATQKVQEQQGEMTS